MNLTIIMYPETQEKGWRNNHIYPFLSTRSLANNANLSHTASVLTSSSVLINVEVDLTPDSLA